ncbi:hypothetical protein [Desulfurivibrio sp. C05AmB]|uniref:hypothetical protein n=1 Tax=Desulfurivibrio sp. C05AmB TaxID=3374371 RepID=UPI00376ED8F4
MTSKGHITYKLSSSKECIAESPVPFIIENSEYSVNALLKTSEDELLLRLDLEGPNLSQGSHSTTDLIAKQVIEWLAVRRGVTLLQPEVLENELGPPLRWGPWSKLSTFTISVPPPITINHVDVNELASHLNSKEPEIHMLFGMYALAMEQSPIAKFMLLYSILYFIAGDSQGKIDKLIWSLSPGEQHIERARHDKEGTRFTKIRNDIGHPKRRDRAEINRLEPDVKNALSDLCKVVRMAINRYY